MTEHDRNVVVLSTLRAVLSRLDSLTRSPAALNGPQAPAAADVPLAEQIRRWHRLICQKDAELFGESPMLDDLDKSACVCLSKADVRALATEIVEM
ncbi:hypothetical protein PtB15_15B318 [Puccinia triticina]|nr:hypothetical protein PtB15_15B318 [Puccinia triticina]